MSVRSFFKENLAAAKEDYCYYFRDDDLKQVKEGRIFVWLLLCSIFITTIVIDLGYLIGLHRITKRVLVALLLVIAQAVGILAGVAGIALCFVGAFQFSAAEPPLFPLKFLLSAIAACMAATPLFFLPKLPPIRRRLDDD